MRKNYEGKVLSAQEWNDAIPVGTPVRYWPVSTDSTYTDTVTASEARTEHLIPVVWLKGVAGYVRVSHLLPLPSQT